MKVPMIDLGWQYQQCKEEIDVAVGQVLSRGDYILGDEVTQLEKAVAEYCGTRYAIGVANGTDALVLALRALGLREGDVVALPALTFVATAHAVVRAGGVPCFIDVDADTGNMSMDSLVKQINHRVKGTEMFWDRPQGAERILQIRAAILSDDDRLDRYLKHRPGSPYVRRSTAQPEAR